jgi:hypothetical protein
VHYPSTARDIPMMTGRYVLPYCSKVLFCRSPHPPLPDHLDVRVSRDQLTSGPTHTIELRCLIIGRCWPVVISGRLRPSRKVVSSTREMVSWELAEETASRIREGQTGRDARPSMPRRESHQKGKDLIPSSQIEREQRRMRLGITTRWDRR